MSKQTRLNRTVQRAIERRLEKTKPPKPSLRSRVARVLVFAIGIPGVLAATLYFVPRLTTTVSDPVDPRDPFSFSITVTNTGIIPLKKALPGLCWDQITIIRPQGPSTLLGDCQKQTIYISEWIPHDLGLDESFTFSLNQFLGSIPSHGASLVSARIGIVVRYQLPWIRIHREKRFSLFAKRQSNGNFYWYSGTPSLPDSN
jgi:hypothetical protein